MVLLIMLSCHSWLGPGILCSWAVGCVLVFRWHCTVIEIRSLVLARDDGIAGMCAKRVLQGKIQSVDLLVKRRRCLLGKMLRKVNRECSLGNSFCF